MDSDAPAKNSLTTSTESSTAEASQREIGFRELLPLFVIGAAALAIIGWQFADRYRPRRPVDFPFSYFNEDDSRQRRGRRQRGSRPRSRTGSQSSVDYPFMNAERVETAVRSETESSSNK